MVPLLIFSTHAPIENSAPMPWPLSFFSWVKEKEPSGDNICTGEIIQEERPCYT